MSSGFSFKGSEQKKNEELNRLFEEWIAQLSKNSELVYNGSDRHSPRECFAKDGFFPGYFSQKKKVCFIGRETRYIGGHDFRDTTKVFFEEMSVNGNNWWRHILYIMYGIKREGQSPFSEIPTAEDILAKMTEKNDFGFAVVNISKFSNDSDTDWQMNMGLVDRFLKYSALEKTNFFQRELEILNPDIIITANLWNGKINADFLDLCLPDANFSDIKSLEAGVAEYGKYNLSGRKIDYIDLYHFSALKNDEECYYNPVMRILFEK